MPPRAQESKAAMYSAIFFAAVFIIATVAAVIFYVKAEDFKKTSDDLQDKLDEVAKSREVNKLGALVGKPSRGQSYMGALMEYFDGLAGKMAGPLDDDTSAEVKFSETISDVNSVLELISDETFDPGQDNVIDVIKMLNQSRLAALELAADNQMRIEKLQADIGAIDKQYSQEETEWIGDLDKQGKTADLAQQRHDDIETLINNRYGEQLESMNQKLEDTRGQLQQKENELLKTKAELNKTDRRMKQYLATIESIKPKPLQEVKAYVPDGKIVSVDPATGIVILNLGSQDHVYPGLTFAVYNRNAPIPADGKGKAEVEVFSVEKRICVARIKEETVDQKQSLIAGDPIANLIWNADDINTFVVAGRFKIDGSNDGADKIKQLIEEWDAQVAEDVTIDTDFVVLGKVPLVPAKPSMENINMDPTAMDRYDAKVKESAEYKEIIDQAKSFSIPVFDVSRFMYFIGQGDQI